MYTIKLCKFKGLFSVQWLVPLKKAIWSRQVITASLKHEDTYILMWHKTQMSCVMQMQRLPLKCNLFQIKSSAHWKKQKGRERMRKVDMKKDSTGRACSWVSENSKAFARIKVRQSYKTASTVSQSHASLLDSPPPSTLKGHPSKQPSHLGSLFFNRLNNPH